MTGHGSSPPYIGRPTGSVRLTTRTTQRLMGGLAAIVDWQRPIERDAIDGMLSHVPHRASAGTAQARFDHAALGEARSDPDLAPLSITSFGSLSIIGDLRLWNRQGLIDTAGGTVAAEGLDDRQLILAAYARSGIAFLDRIDGDFAFVIWDERRQRALAVRDRFAVKPLFYETTPTGIRFATEQKQLLATTSRSVEPSDIMVAEFLTNRYRSSRRTFFDGISSVGPAEYVLAESDRLIHHGYWDPPLEATDLENDGAIARHFRERLIESVRWRASASEHPVAHLTGGLDSSSITAAANAIARDREQLPLFDTVSAVFPGFDTDESMWIQEIADGQLFPNHTFVPDEETIEQFAAVMWQVDTPIHNRIRGLWSGSANIAAAIGADLLLMGSGGDDVLDQDQLLPDLLRSRRLRQWTEGTRAESNWFGVSRALPIERSLRLALPPGFKRPFRGVSHRFGFADHDRIIKALRQSHESLAPPIGALRLSAPSHTQVLAVAATHHPRRTLFNESQEAEFAYLGIDVSYPYLDRSLVEFVASIPPARRPFDGSAKALVRRAFADELPRSVLDRRTKTLASGYLDAVLLRLGTTFRTRYPAVTDAASRYLDPVLYAKALTSFDVGDSTRQDCEALWNAWTLMLWLDGVRRYQGPWQSTTTD